MGGLKKIFDGDLFKLRKQPIGALYDFAQHGLLNGGTSNMNAVVENTSFTYSTTYTNATTSSLISPIISSPTVVAPSRSPEQKH